MPNAHQRIWPVSVDPRAELSLLPSVYDDYRSMPLQPGPMALECIRTGGGFLITLPPGIFCGQLGTSIRRFVDDDHGLRDLLLGRGLSDNAPHPKFRWYIDFQERRFYSKRAIDMLGPASAYYPVFVAISNFLESAEKDPHLVIPRGQIRKSEGAGIRAPRWQRHEDDILRRWFSRQEDGSFNRLEHKDWINLTQVHLKGRTIKQIRARLAFLNSRLKTELGLKNRKGRPNLAVLKTYLERRLGQYER